MRILFASYSSMLYALRDNTVEASQLNNGLFYFASTRKFVMNPPEGANTDDAVKHAFTKHGIFDRDTASRIVIAAKTVALQAEFTGRAIFRQPGEDCSYGHLNLLLRANGHGMVDEHLDDGRFDDAFSYPGVRERVRRAKLDLLVVPNY